MLIKSVECAACALQILLAATVGGALGSAPAC